MLYPHAFYLYGQSRDGRGLDRIPADRIPADRIRRKYSGLVWSGHGYSLGLIVIHYSPHRPLYSIHYSILFLDCNMQCVSIEFGRVYAN
jgi:hypothetical protein